MTTNPSSFTGRIRNALTGLRERRTPGQAGQVRRLVTYEPEALVYAPPTDDELGRGAYEPYVEPSVRLAAAWSWRGLVVLAALVAAYWLLSKVTAVLLPALIAMLIAALLNPVSQFLRNRLRFPNALAAATAFLGAIVVVAGLLSLVGQQIVSGFPALAGQVVAGYNAIVDWLMHNPFGLEAEQVATFLDDGLQQALTLLESNASRIAGGAAGAAAGIGNFLTGLILTLFTAFFFILDGRRIFTWFVGLLPVPARSKAEGAALRGWQTLVQYVRVQIIVAAVDALGILIGGFLIGLFAGQMPLLIPLTVLVFLGSFIPIVGAVATGAIAVLVSLVTQGFVPALFMLLVVLLVQQLEGNVLQPMIMGKAVSVHPLAVVLAVAAGAFLYGIPGALFAVPAVAVANTVLLFLAGRDLFAEDAAEAGEDPADAAPDLEHDDGEPTGAAAGDRAGAPAKSGASGVLAEPTDGTAADPSAPNPRPDRD